jgi:hypothetical protein
MTHTTVLNAALQYEKLGWSVIPLIPKGKSPLYSWTEFQKRRATPEEITEWFIRSPDLNLGIVTGAVSGIAVVDLDGTIGQENGAKLSLASTLTSLTGDGKQLFYKYREGICNTASKLAEKVDVRGEGGYVVAPPSTHPNGKQYRWINPVFSVASLPEFPANLFATAKIADKTTTNGNSWIANALDGLKEGNRDTTFARVVGRLHHSGLDPITIRALLSPYADSCSFTGLDKVIKSITRYDRAVNAVNAESGGQSIEEFMQESEPVEWIVPDLIAKSSIGFIAGLPETLKTWLMIDLAIECARGGGNWLGLFPVSAARVLFVDQERFKGETQRRLRKVIGAKGLTATSLRDSLYVSCGTTTRLNLDESFRAFRSKLLELRPDLVIIDSFATFHTEDENDRRNIQTVIERVKQLREEVGATFIFIDHETKSVFTDKENKESPSAFRMVGSVGKSAAAEFVFTVRRYDPTTSTVYHTKSTLCPTVACFNATVKDVQDGIIVEGKAE